MRDLRNELNIDLPRCRGMYLEEAPSSIFTDGDWVIEEKIDGERVSLQIGEKESLLIGRNRQDFMKGVDKAGRFRDLSDSNLSLSSAIACRELDGTILDGELTETFTQDGEWTENTRVRSREGKFIGFTSWTVLFVRGQDVRAFPEELRYKLTKAVIEKLRNKKIRISERVSASMENLTMFFDRGEEGAVAKKLGQGIPIDSKTNPWWWKLKADKTVDAFIIGVQEGKSGGSGIKGIKRIPNGKACTFTVAMMSGNNIVEVGKMSNLTDGMKDFGFSAFNSFKNEVVEMRVSGWAGKRFRYPRFIRFRTDKSPKDCVFEEQVKGENVR